MVGAVVNSVQARPFACQRFIKSGVDRLQQFLIKIAPSNTCLIGYQDRANACHVQFTYGLGRPGIDPKPVCVVDIARLFADGPVTVHEDCTVHTLPLWEIRGRAPFFSRNDTCAGAIQCEKRCRRLLVQGDSEVESKHLGFL